MILDTKSHNNIISLKLQKSNRFYLFSFLILYIGVIDFYLGVMFNYLYNRKPTALGGRFSNDDPLLVDDPFLEILMDHQFSELFMRVSCAAE